MRRLADIALVSPEPTPAFGVTQQSQQGAVMQTSIAIVGSGPTALYTLKSLVETTSPLRIVIYEQGEKAGVGMPYSAETSNRAMLANIASIEIPPLVGSYLDWLQGLPNRRLRSYGLVGEEVDARTFTPRLLLGEYFRDQLLLLADQAWHDGHQIEFRERTKVIDIDAADGRVSVRTDQGDETLFDQVVIATGHDFREPDEDTLGYFPCPWSGLINQPIGDVLVGILGTSLSAIDTVMAVALQHGAFQRCSDGTLTFLTTSRDLKITMLSRNGLLPEADFYCPIPYTPLKVLTHEQVARLADDTTSTLDQIFALFAEELALADPQYAVQIGLDTATADDFADRYFAERLAHDPFDWAHRNLEEVEDNKAAKRTVSWRYAILRMHEVFQTLVPNLSETDHDRFNKGLRRVFIDNYAAVPPESIRRLLALHEAGLLRVASTGDDYDLSISDWRTRVTTPDQSFRFDIFIDARGQKALTSADLPFPSLRAALVAAGQDVPEVDDAYQLTDLPQFAGRVAFGAIPYLMHDRPFVQGITESHEIGQAIARGLLHHAPDVSRRLRRKWA